ncbi:MAG: type II secretion system protein [Candidatus Saganbacteria bacterium]|nr:type II secretion system protein [Candidatus Saganbacteria bacterium]
MRRPGFTLVEILIVISILAVTLSISLPTFYSFSGQLSLNASARTVASKLRQLQSQAMLVHETQSLNLASLNLPASIIPIAIGTISFSHTGNPAPGGSGTIILQNRFGKTKSIIVSSLGRVRIE